MVPHGEPFRITARLTQGSRWHPSQGRAQWDNQRPVLCAAARRLVRFELPAQIVPGRLRVSVGDATHWVQIEPMLRPELTSIVADVKLPGYLGGRRA